MDYVIEKICNGATESEELINAGILENGEIKCPVCGENFCKKDSQFIYCAKRNEKNYLYYTCPKCESIFIEPQYIELMDKGERLVNYDDTYWDMEEKAAVERCYSVALARMAEALYYCRIPVDKFLDIGGGTGQFLDAVKLYLPDNSSHFYSIEKYPPEKSRTKSENYFVGDYDVLKDNVFQCGMCIEVVEHLTPNMLIDIFGNIAKLSEKGALYLINSGFNDFVQKENVEYLDPFIRGHIISYSLKGLQALLSPLGFNIMPVEGKTWLMACEYRKDEDCIENTGVVDRIWTALPENMKLLSDSKMGGVLRILGLESARAYV